VQVHLAVHVEAGQEEALDGGQPLLAVDGQARAVAVLRDIQAQRREQPVDVEQAVAYAGHVAVAHEVVAAVDIEGAGDGAREVADRALAVDQALDHGGHPGVDLGEHAVHGGVRVEQDP
jgi:hypothetical protein